jgi:eukaryotic-like serine/threonine-protein kinase
MALSAGTRLGPYEILSALGAGGMGEVYRARDTKLNRDVAIKVLPELFANDPERLARFRREAQMLAALNHPNIAHIHGFEDSGGIHALVMELVDGPTLAERIALGPIPLTEALTIATQIAQALEAAHEQGIVHRDLKPANVKVRDDGTVKVLDFGLARLVAPDSNVAGAGPALTQSPTLTTPAATLAGVILGTAAYMSPEQAKGRVADKRSDVWAFGVVLYEMLTGRRPFEGEDLSDTLATVLKSEPDWNALPADVPPHVRMLIQRCLAKDRRQRIADMSVTLFVLSEEVGRGLLDLPRGAGSTGPGRQTRPPLWRRLLMPAAAAIVVGAAVGTVVWLAMRPSLVHVTRFLFSPTGTAVLSVDPQSRDFTITPDGTHIVYKGGTGANTTQLFVRALDQLEPTPLTGPGNPRGLFSSPDGQWIGFVEVGAPVTLKKVAITGGPALALCRLDGASRGATWGDDDSIVFATTALGTGLQRVSAAGGEPTVLTKPNPEQGEADHLWPQFLPGSKAVLFTITATTGGIDTSQVAVLDFRTGTQKILIQGGSQARYVRSGHLVYVAAGTVRAVGFDLERLEAIGTATPVVSQLVMLPSGTAEFDIADAGTLAYLSGGAGLAPRTLVWVDRQGREEAIKAAARPYVSARLSPDGTRVAVDIRDLENDIWVWDFARETLVRVTSDPGLDQAPVWMPDGRRLVFSSQAGGATNGSLFWQPADATGLAERLTSAETASGSRPSAVSADGASVLFTGGTGSTGLDVMMLTLDKDRRVQPLVQTAFLERSAELSPDGRWLAYESNDSGQFQIFVRPFPDVNRERWQVSTGGGTQAMWTRNGRELLYLGPTGAVMSAPVGRGATWTAGTPTKLIDGQYFHGTGNSGSTARTYDVSPDGKRFLMIKPGVDQTSAPISIVVVQNWYEELKHLVPSAR